MHLKYYSTEQEYFKAEYDKVFDDADTETVYGKMKTHYRICQALRFRGNTNGHCRRFEIMVPHGCSLGLLVHEVAHAIQLKKGKPAKWHTKRHFALMKRIMRYAGSHCDMWIASEGKKTERMMQTIERHEKKAEEFRQFKKTPEYKLQRTVAKIKQWESKKKRAETCLKKLYRRKRLYEKTLNLG